MITIAIAHLSDRHLAQRTFSATQTPKLGRALKFQALPTGDIRLMSAGAVARRQETRRTRMRPVSPVVIIVVVAAALIVVGRLRRLTLVAVAGYVLIALAAVVQFIRTR